MTDLRSRICAAALAMTAAAGALAVPILEPITQKFVDGLAGDPAVEADHQ
jgi:acetyl esterase